MGRRKILVIVAVLVAALGTGVVGLYVKGANSRADQKFQATQVLVAKDAINAGETVAAAKTAGKLVTKTVTTGSLVPGAVSDPNAIPDDQVATTNIYPGEQILSSKFGANLSGASQLGIPDGNIAISIQLDDTARVAGFVNPGDHVVIFASSGSSGDASDNAKDGTRVLLADVNIIGVGSTTTVNTTKTDATGAQTTESLPRTIMTLSVDQTDAQKIIYAQTGGQSLTFGLLSDKSVINKGLTPTNMSNVFN